MGAIRTPRRRATRIAIALAAIAGAYLGFVVLLSQWVVAPPRTRLSDAARPVLGVGLRERPEGGVVVEYAVAPARLAGLRDGDRLVRVADRAIVRAADVPEAIAGAAADEIVRVEAVRTGSDGAAMPIWADVPVDVRFPSPADAGLDYVDCAFEDAAGRVLRGWYVPAPASASPAPGVVYAHGNGGDRRQWMSALRAVHRAGFAQLLFDFAGRGESDGKHITLGPREADGIRAALDALAERPEVDGANLAVVGRSMGAAAAILAADGDPRIRALVLDSPFASLERVIDDNLRAFGIPPALFRGPLSAVLALRVRVEPREVRPDEVIARLRVRVLLFHGEADTLVPVEHARTLARAGGDAVRLITWPGLDHNSPRPDDLDERIAEFLAATVIVRGPDPRS